MGQREKFAGGFLAGAIVGGIVGGLIGSALTSRRNKNLESAEDPSLIEPGLGEKFETEEEMEKARRSLENKIAQLNHAIDDVRQQLGAVNTNSSDEN